MPEHRPGPGPGTLWREVVRRSERATASGALQRIETRERFIEEGGVRFVVRAVSSLARKDRARAGRGREPGRPGAPVNPFLPFDPELFVAELSDTHVCLLNKFNVLDHHLLVVTRAFEDQESPLTLPDFEALWACLAEVDGLGFYNAGAVAGASQPHKHLQLVPLPLASEGPRVPIEPLLKPLLAPGRAGVGAGPLTVPGLPFRHALVPLDPSLARRRRAAAAAAHARYHALLAAAEAGGGARRPGPYNLLLTREWMLLVPRSRECFRTISVNALGFAGSLFVRDAREMRAIEAAGPMTVLRHVAVAPEPGAPPTKR